MYPQSIAHYFRPDTADEVLALLAEYGASACIIAGGQSLVPLLKARSLAPQALIDINRVAGLDTITVSPDALHCGALVRCAAAAQHLAVRSHWSALADAAAGLGDRQVRNRGTLLGSLVFAAHWGDIAPAAAVFDASVEIRNAQGTREVALQDFILAPGRTILASGEFATGLRLPRSSAASVYLKHGRATQDRAALGVAVAMQCDDQRRCLALRIAVGGLAEYPAVRVTAVEDDLCGRQLDASVLTAAGEHAAQILAIQDDELASADYRRQLLRVYVPRALELAVARGRERQS